MNENNLLDEQAIGDIILCEPITRKGKEALDRLGLSIQEISPSYFYENLRVASKYDEDKSYENKISDQMQDNHLYYQYTVDFMQFKELKNRLKEFNSRFCSDSPNEYPLLMLGVAGNGKSIEVNRLIREMTFGENEFECGKAYFDLEEAFSEVTYGSTYQCPDNTTLWLFCIKLLDGIMKYIRHCHLLCPVIINNFNNIIVKNNIVDDKQKELFESIGAYCYEDNSKETKVFMLLKSFLNSQQAEKSIQALLKILMLIMYCSEPNKKQYIVIDNIEQYIKLDDSRIQIPNSDISKLYKSINTVVTNMINAFGRIEKDLGWKAFKIIIVLRRTSVGLLDSTLLHAPVKAEQNIADVTGYFQIPDIWKKKKRHIWNEKLRNRYNNSQNRIIIDIVDKVMFDVHQTTGTDYQSMIAPLMSYGIRRNARTQAHAAYNTYEILTNGNRVNINLDEFNLLMSNKGGEYNSIRYMFRKALIEFQFKWALSGGNRERWKRLGIGHLTGRKKRSYGGREFDIEGVEYFDNNNVTLMRRILTYLSYFPDEHNIARNHDKLIVDMFSTVSLYDLIKGVLVSPLENKEILDDDFVQFARVLIALSDMSNGDTKSAPYVVLGVNDEHFHMESCDLVLAELLKKIWNEGHEKSVPGQKYNCSDFGVRITDAGYSFLLDWQASFSFMASLYCFTIPSLFFLKDISSIKYVIDTVYNASLNLCEMYEREARRFCGESITLKTGTYLPKQNNKYITFKHRVKELHINHLNLYRDYIKKNYSILGLSKNDMQSLTAHSFGFISRYMDKYNRWNTMEGTSECF